MSTYKLIQDIEAEDKILGPLTLRQFIFALITAFLLYICFILVAKHLSFLLVMFLPPAMLTGFFAFPFGRDQPTEVWALGKLRFWFKPRQRIWDQSGVKEMVTITVPKKIEHNYTNGLTQGEVQSRLKALANTIDSRGWAVKNMAVSSYPQDPVVAVTSDRLLDMSAVPQAVPEETVLASEDIMDVANNPIAQQFDNMITQSTQQHRQALITQLNSPAPPVAARPGDAPAPTADYWFMNQSSSPGMLPADQTMFNSGPVVLPAAIGQAGPAPFAAPPLDPAAEEAMSAQLKANTIPRNSSIQGVYSHMRTIQPLGSTPPAPPPAAAATPVTVPSTPDPDPAILYLANNNDLNVATLAREAHKAKARRDSSQDQVVISLH